jgi:UDP-glucose 4-epimerase
MLQLLTAYPAGEILCLVKPTVKPQEAAALEAFRAAGVGLIEADLARPVPHASPDTPVDVIYHLAANIDTAATGAELDVNDLGTEHLLAWLGERARGARIIYTSSVAVHDRRGTSKGQPLNETSPFCPRTEYGTTKLRGEEILQNEAASRGYTYTILRLATVYGPGHKPGGLFDTFARYATHQTIGGRLDWPGRTSIIHADDASALMIELAQRLDASNEVYCVANPQAPTVGELAREIGGATGHPVEPIRVPCWLWAVTRALVCSPVIYALTPRTARLSLWRLSLIVDHGCWFDTSKLQSLGPRKLKTLGEGLAGMFGPPPRD